MIQQNSLAHRTLDTLPFNIAVIDDEGTILFTNRAWDEFAGVGSSDRDELIGVNYFESMDTDGDEYAAQALEGLYSVIEGERQVFTLEYPCHSPEERRWFLMRAAPLPDHDEGSVVIAHIDITQRKLAEIRAREQRRELEHLMSRIEGLVRDVMESVLHANGREEIEQTVCDRLFSVEPYVCAWVSQVDLRTDTLTPTTSACEAFPEDGSIELGTDDPAVRAAETGEPQIIQDTATVDLADIHTTTLLDEPGALASFPLVYGETKYGVLTVAATEEDAFDDRELAVLSVLARVASTAINAVEGRRILTTDSVVEMEVGMNDEALFFGDLSSEFDCTFTYEGSLYEDEGAFVMLFVVDGGDPDAIVEAAAGYEGIESVTRVSQGDSRSVVEFTVDDPPIVSALAERGVETTAITADRGEVRITLEMPASADPRAVIEQLSERYPSTDLLAHRERERPEQTKQELVADIEERLTDRQRLALQKAFLGGFFDWPRSISGEDLAESMDISPSTYHQHLRAAERKVLAALFRE
ncbi:MULTISPECIES: bacterio-opsin activator domain-containing protein [Salinibaculum]|uniref:bacterio-opsin activator domain-containing protein n=1 Tax=Salinibaculum TaxID=2732368 RepID=UPI0030D254D7